MSVAFSPNRSIPLNLSSISGEWDYSESLKMFVFGSVTGSLMFVSDRYEFELDNPVDQQTIRNVCMSELYGIVVTLSHDIVQVWDCFRSVEGKWISPVQTVPLPSKARSIHLSKSTNSCFIGLENGKVYMMDLQACATYAPLPRYSASSCADVGSPITCIAPFATSHLLFGTASGTVKAMKLDSKRLTHTVKPPKSGLAVTGILPVLHNAGDAIQFAVTYNAPLIALVRNETVSTLVDTLPEPARSVFTTSVSDPQESPLLVLLESRKLVRLVGPRWSHESVVADTCFSLSASATLATEFTALESTAGITTMKQYRIVSGLGPLVSLPAISVGSLSLSAIGRVPIKSVCLSKSDPSIEPNLIRLCDRLSGYVGTVTSDRLVFDYNGGLWEGVIASVVNGPSELLFTLYSQTSAVVVGRVPIDSPPLAIVSSFFVSCIGQDKWSIVVGFSSGQVGVVESFIDFPDPRLGWKPILMLPAAEEVHAGSKIVSVDRSVAGGSVVTSVDVTGMVCFVRLTEPTLPAHVAISGDRGLCFADPANASAYLAMSGGVVERIRTPRMKKDGTEESHDPDVWSTCTVLDGISGLAGDVVNVFPSDHIVVLSDGIAIVKFSKSDTAVQTAAVAIPSYLGLCICEAEIVCVQSKKYVVIVTESHIAAYETKHASLVFHRSHLDIPDASIVPTILGGSLHAFKWASSLTSFSFEDRAKYLSAPERILRAAQAKFAFKAIQSTPLLQEVTTESKASGSSASSKADKKKQALEDKYKPTQHHLDEARNQLKKNLEAMAKLQDDAAEMQEASADFLNLAKNLEKKEKKKRFFGLF